MAKRKPPHNCPAQRAAFILRALRGINSPTDSESGPRAIRDIAPGALALSESLLSR